MPIFSAYFMHLTRKCLLALNMERFHANPNHTVKAAMSAMQRKLSVSFYANKGAKVCVKLRTPWLMPNVANRQSQLVKIHNPSAASAVARQAAAAALVEEAEEEEEEGVMMLPRWRNVRLGRAICWGCSLFPLGTL